MGLETRIFDLQENCHPPCIKKLFIAAATGEKINHSQRFTLITYFHALGVSNDDILLLLSHSKVPDKALVYQVNHATGVSSCTEYSASSCDTMRTYGNCPQRSSGIYDPPQVQPDPLCQREWMTHPIKYYKVKTRPSRIKEKEESLERTAFE